MSSQNSDVNSEDLIQKFLLPNYSPEIRKKYEKVCEKLTSDLDDFKELYYDEYRFNLIDHISDRVKDFESLKKKIIKKNRNIQNLADVEEEFQKINDLAGVRYACPYSDQILDSIDMIRQYLKTKNYDVELKGKNFQNQNNLESGNQAGYRSNHYFVKVPISISSSGEIEKILCEIQVRSELQNTWAVKSHNLIYKPKIFNSDLGDNIVDGFSENIFQDCKNEMKIQSDLLNIVDEIFVNIRKKIEREIKGENN